MADKPNLGTPDAGDLNAAARRQLAESGAAMDDGSYPIRPADNHGRADLEKAIHAVGRGSGSHEAIRAHIIKRARAIGATELLPDDWTGDGRGAADPAGGVLYRSVPTDLEVRSKGDGRTIVGIAVPYERDQRIDSRLTERFARSAFGTGDTLARAAGRVKFARDHLGRGGTVIGVTTLLRDDPAGLYGEWRVSKTPAGEETLELVRDGALTDLSIGFREGQNRSLRGGVTERVSAELREVAVVLEGAYGEGALVAGVRSLACTCGCHDQGRARLEEANQALARLPVLPA
ncbi:MAG: HK97 family phage prohead protease [Streptosporangiales bacterium]